MVGVLLIPAWPLKNIIFHVEGFILEMNVWPCPLTKTWFPLNLKYRKRMYLLLEIPLVRQKWCHPHPLEPLPLSSLALNQLHLMEVQICPKVSEPQKLLFVQKKRSPTRKPKRWRKRIQTNSKGHLTRLRIQEFLPSERSNQVDWDIFVICLTKLCTSKHRSTGLMKLKPMQWQWFNWNCQGQSISWHIVCGILWFEQRPRFWPNLTITSYATWNKSKADPFCVIVSPSFN